MKLIDLQELFEPTTSEVRLNKSFKQNPFPKKGKNELGRGTFSVVHDNPEDPHTVKKSQIIRGDYDKLEDSFDSYARIVMKHKLWDKIHFPRIYSSKLILDKDGRKQYHWDIEKLVELTSLSEDEINDLAHHYFSEGEAPSAKSNPWVLSHMIAKCITSKSYRTRLDDEQLIEACDIMQRMLEHLKKRNQSVRLDLHAQNIMVRRTPVGPQLVFTDPFAG